MVRIETPGPRDSSPYSELAIDMVGYSRLTAKEQARAREELSDLLEETAEEARVQREQWQIQDTGDGELALIPSSVSKARLVADFVRELNTALGERNHRHTPEARIRLRVALNHGEARVQGTGFPGDAPVVACRLVDSAHARAALEANKDAQLVLILSDRMFQDTVAPRERGLNPRHYTRVEIKRNEIKKGDPARVAWVTVPGFDPPAPAEAPEPATAAAGGTTQTISGSGVGVQATGRSQATYSGSITNIGRGEAR